MKTSKVLTFPTVLSRIVVLNLYAFSANAAQIKRQTSMKTKLFCSNRRNQLNVEDVRSANQEREFLALDQS